METYFLRIAESLILPPGGNIALLLLSYLCTAEILRKFVQISACLALYICSLPAITTALAVPLEVYPALKLEKNINAEAIVVVAAGTYKNAMEYGQHSVGSLTLQRIRYAAWLQKKTGLPILVSGGRLNSDLALPAEVMHDTLTNEFNARVQWVEKNSRNTYENAVNSGEILKTHDIRNIVLVTHAWHMKRTVDAFSNQGLEVYPAPTLFSGKLESPALVDFLPSAKALYMNRLLLHENIGNLWYKIRY